MKIVHLTKFASPCFGGVERATFEMALAAHRLGAEVQVIGCLDKEDPSEIPEGVAPIRSYFNLGPVPVTLGYYQKMPEIRQADVIHLHVPNPMAEATLALFRSDWAKKAKLVPVFHAPVLRGGRLGKLWQSRMYRHLAKVSDKIVVPSPQLLNYLGELDDYHGVTSVMPFPISMRAMGSEPEPAPFSGRREGPFRLLCVGRLVYYKGYQVLLNALGDLPGDWTLDIVGVGPMQEHMEAIIEERGLQGRVKLLGSVEENEKNRLIRDCDLFLFPSCTAAESFGIAAGEAFYFGKPVIMTNLPTGVQFLARKGQCGAMVEPGNQEELLVEMKALMEDSERRRLCGQKNREFWQRELSTKTYEERYERLLSDLFPTYPKVA